MPHSGEARQKILQLRQLNLQSAFPAARALRENIQDQLCSIEDFAREQILQVPSLRGREFVIENHRGDLSILTRIFDLLRFAAADVKRRGRFLQFLRHRIDHFGPRGVGQFSQLFEGIPQVPF